jgi:hypothetical protein
MIPQIHNFRQYNKACQFGSNLIPKTPFRKAFEEGSWEEADDGLWPHGGICTCTCKDRANDQKKPTHPSPKKEEKNNGRFFAQQRLLLKVLCILLG